MPDLAPTPGAIVLAIAPPPCTPKRKTSYKTPSRDRGVPPLPRTPLERLADDEPLWTRAYCAYAQERVATVEAQRQQDRAPVRWRTDPLTKRPYVLAGD